MAWRWKSKCYENDILTILVGALSSLGGIFECIDFTFCCKNRK